MSDLVNRLRLQAEDLHSLNPASETVKCLSLGADEIERLRAENAALQAKIDAQVEAPLQVPPTGNALMDAYLTGVAKKEAPAATTALLQLIDQLCAELERHRDSPLVAPPVRTRFICIHMASIMEFEKERAWLKRYIYYRIHQHRRAVDVPRAFYDRGTLDSVLGAYKFAEKRAENPSIWDKSEGFTRRIKWLRALARRIIQRDFAGKTPLPFCKGR